MTTGVEIPITTPGGPQAAETLRSISSALTGVGAAASTTSKAFSFNEVRQAITSVHGDIKALASAVSELASEQSRLDANSSRLGLDFNAAADAAGRFTDETEAMGAATRLAEAGINLTQAQLDALTRVAARFAQNTGTTTAQAIDQLTNGLITGSQRGLRPFGDELARSAGNSHTATERLHALTAQAGHIEQATDDAASAMARFNDSIDDATRTMAHGFAEGVMQMLRFDSATDSAADRAENLTRSIHAVGAAMGETIVRVTTGVGELLGFVAIAVTSITSGIAAIGGGLVHLATGHIRGIGAAMTSAAQYGGIGAATEFTAHMNELRRQQSAAGDEQTTAAPMTAPRVERPGVTMIASAQSGDDLATKRIMARVQLMHDAATLERADLDRTIAVRQRDLELQRLVASGLEDQIRVRTQLAELTGRVAVSERNTDARQIERVRGFVDLLREREAHTSGARRTSIQHDINELVAEEVALTRRIEDAVHSVRLANAQRYAEERTAFAATRVAERAEEEAQMRRRRVASSPMSDREIVLGRRETIEEQLARASERDAEMNARRRAVSRDDREAAQRTELEGARDPAEQRFRLDEMRRARVLDRERAHLQRRYEMQRTYVDRMEELHDREIIGTEVLATSLTSAFKTTGDALATHLQAFAEGRETAAEAAQNMLADTLTNMGKEALVKSGFYFAQGLGNLASLNFPGAATAFAASAAFAAVGGGLVAGGSALVDTNTLGARKDAAAQDGAREPAARVSKGSASGTGEGAVYNINFGGPMYGTGGVRRASREIVGVINRGAVQGGVQLLPGTLQGGGAGA